MTNSRYISKFTATLLAFIFFTNGCEFTFAQEVQRGQDWRKGAKEEEPPKPKMQDKTSTKEDSKTPAAIKAKKDEPPILWKRPQVISVEKILSKGSDDGKYGMVEIQFLGVDALKPDQLCQGINTGREWKCGRFAKGALTLLIRGRPLTCIPNFADKKTDKQSDKPAKEKPIKMTTKCSIDGRDISLWLVEHGWAVPAAKIEDDEFKNALNKALEVAKKDGRGQWLLDKPRL